MENKQIQRNSTFELIRIIAITFIFLHHCLIRLGLMNYWNGSVDIESYKILGICLNSFFIIGVNLFILISGYFTINFKFSKFVKLLCIILVCQLVYLLFAPENEVKNILRSILLLRTQNSFIPSYLALFLLSPLLNKALEVCSYQDLKKIIILVTIVNVFMGFTLGYVCIDPNGYNLFNFIYLYIFGYFLRRAPFIRTYKLVSLYFLSVIGIMVWAYFYKSNLSAFAYNNPLVLLSAFSFFYIFTKFHFKNEYINKVASCTFCVFLMENFVVQHFFPLNSMLSWSHIIKNIVLDYIILFIIAYIITFFIEKYFSKVSVYFKPIDSYFKFK
ncbi:surface polysaccharide O-acyltransferase-like enzyme [Dysgonomonas alginatilytica]|uniref:Surface polysaccharide O-acyltransferase-like enzyme n=1 Tax=Dysgonomonas alginatilytica TaxID=1605892 RepID=A0A2V3PMU5_9BACT|nr:surface polysaccharide O-acyltransferase-like enzyme [Dysgonomonas alginatilytica]